MARELPTMLNSDGMERALVGSYFLTWVVSLPVINAFLMSYSLVRVEAAVKAVCGRFVLEFTLCGTTFSKLTIFYLYFSTGICCGFP